MSPAPGGESGDYTAGMNTDAATLFLDYSDRKMGEMAKDIKTCLGKLNQEQVWHRSGPYENAIGNIVLHLCGNIRQRMMSGIGGAPDVRVRDAEFSATGGLAPGELAAQLESTVAEARRIVADLPHARLTERIRTPVGELAILEAVYQVVGHLQQHEGQIVVLTKQILGQDLDLTTPRPR